MMDNLFILYRYLVQNVHRTDEDNPYNIALKSLESMLDVLRELDSIGENIRRSGGLVFEEAEHIADFIEESHKSALCTKYGSSMDAILNFISTYVGLKEYPELLDKVSELHLQAQKEHDELTAQLGDLDDHPF